ncbi:DUF3524 domain-containing protein [Marinomonas sp. THO17]|uniref:tRNA-queuosine alpha-mannosyltransferase domain-containing protein n=1 Tax=Marinomonas sp. THO17 TaxID=3149048 RepID=UPI00336BC122
MRILLISAYEASSHKAWANTLMAAMPEHDWHYLSLPARHFAWRIRGNAMSFAFDPKFKDTLQRPYDLVIATSMTDCVGLKAFCPDLQNLPWILYFHENQFAYPANDNQQGVVEMQMVTLYSALAADKCVFNSEFNCHSFFQGAKALLKKLPDYVSPDWLDDTQAKSEVLPVPVSLSSQGRRTGAFGQGKIKLVWAARWEYDKGPENLLAILRELKARHLAFEIAIMGEQFRSYPEVFDQIQIEFAEQITQFGFADNREEYLSILHQADVFLSTALHEFQGLSVLEAVAMGCLPLLPQRQVYPELFDPVFLYPSVLGDEIAEAKGAVDRLLALLEQEALAPNISEYSEEHLIASYQALIKDLVK